MAKKLFFLLVVMVVAFTFNTTLFAQEEEQLVEDVADISLEDLLNVEITTAGKQAEKISEIPASVVLVTREDIEKYGYQTLGEILENIPGLYPVNDYLFENFGVRGFWAETGNRNVIILVNDVEQTDQLSSGHVLQQINVPVEAIDRIEVVRGPMSVIYGTGAFFGVIHIKTNVVEENPVSMLSFSAGSESTYRMFARASGKIDDFQYSFNASYLDTEGIDVPFEKMGDPAIQALYGVQTGQTTGGLLENEEKYFNFSGTLKGFTFNASYTEANKEIFLALPPVDDGSLTKNKALRVSFGYSREFSEKARLEGVFTYYMNKNVFDYDMLYPGFFGFQNNEASGYKLELNMFLNPSPKVNMILGAEYNRVIEDITEVSIPLFGFNNYEMKLTDGEFLVTQSIFAQFNISLSERFKIVAGARVEQVPEYQLEDVYNKGLSGFESPIAGPLTELHNSATYSYTKAEFIPRVALIWGIDENNYLKFLYGKAINRPSFFQSRDLLVYPTSTPLEPEVIQTFELNYLANLTPKFTVNLSVFYNILENLIYRSLFYVGSDLVSYFANVGDTTTTGAEFTLKVAPSERFYLELSGTYQDTKDKREGFEDILVGYSPKFLGYVKASVFFNDDISLAVTGTYVDEMETYYDFTIPARLGEKVDGYFLLGANLRVRKLFGTGLFLNIKGYNVLDQEFFYPATSNSNTYVPYGTLGRGLSFMATLGYKFIPIPIP